MKEKTQLTSGAPVPYSVDCNPIVAMVIVACRDAAVTRGPLLRVCFSLSATSAEVLQGQNNAAPGTRLLSFSRGPGPSLP